MTMTTPSITPTTYAHLIDAVSTTVMIGFIERGRASLSSSAHSLLNTGYDFMSRVYPAPWPKNADTIAILKRDMQIAFLDGLVREGSIGVRNAVLQSYEAMAQAADKRSLEEQKRIGETLPKESLAQERQQISASILPVALPEPVFTVAPVFNTDGVPASFHEAVLHVRHTVSEHMGIELDRIHMGSHFVADLGADSLDQVELIMMLEDRLPIRIDDEAAAKLETIQDAVEIVCAQLRIPVDQSDTPSVAAMVQG